MGETSPRKGLSFSSGNSINLGSLGFQVDGRSLDVFFSVMSGSTHGLLTTTRLLRLLIVFPLVHGKSLLLLPEILVVPVLETKIK